MERTIPIETIFGVVTSVTGVTEEQIRGRCRERKIEIARQIVGVLLTSNGMPQREAGALICRNHSTIAHYEKTWMSNLKALPQMRAAAVAVTERIPTRKYILGKFINQ